jgi:hypothetical protein
MDVQMSVDMAPLDLSTSVYDFDAPTQVGGLIALSKQLIVTSGQWMDFEPAPA